MSATDLLNRLTNAGLTVTVDGARLLVQPRSRLTEDLRQVIKTERSTLISMLTGEQSVSPELGYTLDDLREFDDLIEQYVTLVCPDAKQRNSKRFELLTARWRLAPALVPIELVEFRKLVQEELEIVRGQESAAVVHGEHQSTSHRAAAGGSRTTT